MELDSSERGKKGSKYAIDPGDRKTKGKGSSTTIAKVLKLAIPALVLAVIGTALALVNSAGIAVTHNNDAKVSGAVAGDGDGGTSTVVEVNKEEKGKEIVNALFYENCDVAVKGIQKNDKSTIVYFAQTDKQTKATKITPFVFNGITASSMSELYTDLYDLEQESGTEAALNAITIEAAYEEFAALKNGAYADCKETIDGIDAKLKDIFGKDTVFYQRNNSTVNSRTMRYEMEVFVPGSDTADCGFIKFNQSAAKETDYAKAGSFAGNILNILSCKTLSTTGFGYNYNNNPNKSEFRAMIQAANAAQNQGETTTGTEGQTQTGTTAGAETSDPNASL